MIHLVWLNVAVLKIPGEWYFILKIFFLPIFKRKSMNEPRLRQNDFRFCKKCKATGNHPWEKFPPKNNNKEDSICCFCTKHGLLFLIILRKIQRLFFVLPDEKCCPKT